MYLLINNTQYPVARRRVTSQYVVYSEVNTEPESLSGVIQMYSNEGFLLSEDNVSDYLRHTYQAPTYGEEGEILSYGILTLTNLPEPEPLPESEPVKPEWHATQAQMDAAVRLASAQVMTMSLTADETIEVAALYPEWTLGAYEVGDIRLAPYEDTHQPWKCRQAHDTTTYPDITPTGTAWRTFWIPFHGTTPETAQPWIAPSGAHDQYETGEMMIWTDGTIKRATMPTVYTPDEYPQAWEDVQDE